MSNNVSQKPIFATPAANQMAMSPFAGASHLAQMRTYS